MLWLGHLDWSLQTQTLCELCGIKFLNPENSFGAGHNRRHIRTFISKIMHLCTFHIPEKLLQSFP